MKVLFICNMNQNRSKTAEQLFGNEFVTKSAGLFNENPVSESQLKWADTVVVMEDFQREELVKRFPGLCLQERIIILGIPDIYHYNQPELVDLLKSKITLLA
jgi:predicted protein tyrosine phosphatase